MILLVKFAKERNVNPDTVTTYVRRHPELFEGHTKPQGNKLLLDDEAVRILDEKYPLPKPVEIIEDKESRQKYIEAMERLEKAKDLIQELKDQYNKLQIEKIELETSNILIEEKEKLLQTELVHMKELQKIQENEHIRREDELKNKLQEEFNLQKAELQRQHQEELDAERARKLTPGEAIKRIFTKN